MSKVDSLSRYLIRYRPKNVPNSEICFFDLSEVSLANWILTELMLITIQKTSYDILTKSLLLRVQKLDCKNAIYCCHYKPLKPFYKCPRLILYHATSSGTDPKMFLILKLVFFQFDREVSLENWIWTQLMLITIQKTSYDI